MCMFSRPVARVSNTKLLVVDGGLRQTTVYSNRVALRGGAPTAMILPVPRSETIASATCGIVVHDMTAAADLFTTLDSLFMDAYTDGVSFGLGKNSRSASAAPLAVMRSGAYRYSIVPTLADLGRLQHEVFGVDPASPLGATLAEHYAVGFAFLACIIDADAAFVPIAYTHDKHASGKLFVPTRHWHGDGDGGDGKIGRVWPSSLATDDLYRVSHRASGGGSSGGSDMAHDWDHAIYSIGATGPEAGTAAGPYDELSISLPRSTLATVPFPLPPRMAATVLHKHSIRGSAKNGDIWLPCDAAVRAPPVCTFAATHTAHALQDWFVCMTCAAAGAFNANEGACVACAAKCHAGHALTYAGRTSFFCDCGAGGAAKGCLSLPPT